MTDTDTLQELRIKKIGILIYDARLSSQKTSEECAHGMGVQVEEYSQYENGSKAPSLPEIESLAYFLNIPLEHFWGQSLISENIISYDNSTKNKLQTIRHKMIGTQLRMKREENLLSLEQTAETLNIEPHVLEAYENGDTPIPIPLLESLARFLKIEVSELFDKKGPIGNWRNQQTMVDRFLLLPPDIQQFICDSKNFSYLKLAMKLTETRKDSIEDIKNILEEICSKSE